MKMYGEYVSIQCERIIWIPALQNKAVPKLDGDQQ